MARTKHTARKSVGAKGGKGKAKKQVAKKSVGDPAKAERVEARVAQRKTKRTRAAGGSHPANRQARDDTQVQDNTPVRKHRFKPGTVALRQIRQFQKSTELLLAKARFRRFVLYMLEKIDKKRDFRMEKAALAAFQEIIEAALVDFLEAVNLCAIHAQRVTVMAKDVRFLRRLCSYQLSVFAYGVPPPPEPANPNAPNVQNVQNAV